MASYLIFLSVPGLRPRDIDQANTPTLHSWANRGVLAEIAPTFPCVTSCVQASMMTGAPPALQGIIANGFYYRDRREVEMWTGWSKLVEAPQIWDALRAKGLTSAAWHAQNIKGAAADFNVTPARSDSGPAASDIRRRAWKAECRHCGVLSPVPGVDHVGRS